MVNKAQFFNNNVIFYKADIYRSVLFESYKRDLLQNITSVTYYCYKHCIKFLNIFLLGPVYPPGGGWTPNLEVGWSFPQHHNPPHPGWRGDQFRCPVPTAACPPIGASQAAECPYNRYISLSLSLVPFSFFTVHNLCLFLVLSVSLFW